MNWKRDIGFILMYSGMILLITIMMIGLDLDLSGGGKIFPGIISYLIMQGFILIIEGVKKK